MLVRLFRAVLWTALSTSFAFRFRSGNDSTVLHDCSKPRYFPSRWEKTWKSHIHELQSDDVQWASGCSEIRANRAIVSDISRKIDFLNKLSGHEDVDFNISELSRFVSCGKTIYIEPLVSFLRDPSFLCINNHTALSKSWLLLQPPSYQSVHGSVYFFDVGASLYDAGDGGASQQWFVETYRSHGLELDHIIAWEARLHSPQDIFTRVPGDVKLKLRYFNIPASSAPTSDDNPLRFIRQLCTVHDYVILKIDIDDTATEVALILQLLADRMLSRLVDELYWEHHVVGSPMQYHGWGNLSANSGPYADLAASYKLFSRLRHRGIRAHSWV
jgi:hypothetical protein